MEGDQGMAETIGRAQRMGLACAAAAFGIDQASKAVVLAFAPILREGVELLPIFNLILAHNRGASFGLLSGLPWWALAIVAILFVWLWRTDVRPVGAAIGLVIGGALGNVLDRARWGGVVDFLDFHLGTYHWPAFNMADVAIVSGLGLLLFTNRERRAA